MKTDVHFMSSSPFLLRIRVSQTKGATKIKTYILCSTIFFENLAVYEIMWKIILQSEGPQTAWRMSIAC